MTLQDYLQSNPDQVIYKDKHGQLLAVPDGVIRSLSSSQKLWMDCRPEPGNFPRSDYYAALAYEVYCRRAGISCKTFVPPRVLTPFQFWLRNKLEGWGLI